MAKKHRRQEALDFHSEAPAGKISVVPTKPLSSQHDLALAYSPGVAEPCKEIAANKEEVFKYTAKGNLVGVISNGTAVLGLGDIGPDASKPVMEGKGVLFKKFAGIDVFDIEIDEKDPEKFIQIVKSLEPTFGGINLEDIKAPDSFLIEKTLRREMNIPVMHDDQHGTAIISGAALLNALEIVKKDIDKVKVVVNGAGAAAMACTDLYIFLGVSPANIIMLDSKGVLRKDRGNLDESKSKYAIDTDISTLEEACVDADVFLGLSKGDVLTAEMLRSMAKDPIVFALANPDPEIDYHLAMKTRDDIVMATGRSDHPNQVNNVLGFPYIFRGALDVRSTSINEEMKLAAVKALADLAKAEVPEIVIKAYGGKPIRFGRSYLIPKPLDPRLITTISPAVAKAAMDSGVARTQIEDWSQYEMALLDRVGVDQRLMSRVISRARKDPKRIVFAEADNETILKAAQMCMDERIAEPILLGSKKKIRKIISDRRLDLDNCIIVEPGENRRKIEEYADILYKKRQRKGLTRYQAGNLILDQNYYGAMMVEMGEADALISGLSNDYPKTILPALQIIGKEDDVNRVAGMYIMLSQKGVHFFADTTVNLNPSADELVDIIGLSTKVVHFFDYEPRVAVLSYSNFGSAKGSVPQKAAETVRKAKERWPHLIIDGDIQANVALNKEIQTANYPFSSLCANPANTLIFPDLASGNIAYKLLMELGGAEAIGPILMGMKKPVHVLQVGSSVREIFNMVAIAVVDAQAAKQ